LRQLKITQQLTARDSKSITGYFNDINKIGLIEPEREAELAVRIQQGDERALKELIEGNLRFVVSVAKQYQNKGIPLEDLISEGNSGLIKAAQKFDHTKGFKFISYAVWWIRQAIMAALTETARSIRVPANQLMLMRKVGYATIDFMQDKNREPTAEELSELIDEPVHKIEFIMSNNFQAKSGDAPIAHDATTTLFDLTSSPSEYGAEKQTYKDSLTTDIEQVLDRLPAREAYVIRNYFGIGLDRPKTRLEIAEEMDMSLERIRQIKEKALRRIRNNGWTKLLVDYV
jgi:RNA polymerase primary sigma factor